MLLIKLNQMNIINYQDLMIKRWKILPNIMPQVPSIGIGNLNVGGTGKSVLVDY